MSNVKTIRPASTVISRADKVRAVEVYAARIRDLEREASRLRSCGADLLRDIKAEDETTDSMTNAYRGGW
jgi:hypothetical protein